METRSITEIKLYKLFLKSIRNPEVKFQIVAVSYEREKLIEWYNDQKELEEYTETVGDIVWTKTFKKGSRLEWYAPCSKDFNPDKSGIGIQYEWGTEEMIKTFIERCNGQVVLV